MMSSVCCGLMAQYFKHWQNTAHIRKRQREIYEESLCRAQFYIVHKLQHRYFRQWHTAAEEHRKTKSADTIHRRHMLQKGLQAFQWAILQSKHQSNTLKQRVQAITVRAAFTKWQTLATSRRDYRLRTAFVRWQEYTKEEKIISRMQRNLNGKLLYQAMVTWKCVYYRKVKENIAEHHIRLTRLKHAWHAWRTFAQVSKDKTRSLQLAMSLQRHNTQRTSLHIMIRAWHQSKKARHHFRTKWLAFILHQWHQGTQISQAEHQQDMVVSLEHWHKSITKHFFYNWLQKLFLQKALRFAHKCLYRSAFHHWRTEWQNNMQRLQEVTAAVISNRLHRCLLTWRRNVVDQRRRQKQAVVLVERCLLRSALSSWWQYTVFKMSFRITLQQHLKKIQRVTINCCFAVWKKSLFQRLDEKHKHELWTLSCVRKMAGHWRHVCHLRHLQSILHNTEPDRQLGLLRYVFIKWTAAKRKADKETAEVVASQHVLQHCAMQRCFQEWRLAAQRVLVIKPIILKKERLLLIWYFDAWHGYIQRKCQRQHSKKEFEQNQLARVFALWRRQQECQQLARWSQQQFTQRLVLCLLCEWHAIIHRKHLAYHFHNNSLLVSFFTLWTSRSKKQQHKRAIHLAEQSLNQRLKRHYFEFWLSEMYKQMAVTDTAVVHLKQQQAQNCLRKAFFRWRRFLHVHLMSRAYQHSAEQRKLRTLLLEWHTVTSCSLSEAVQHFALELGLQPQEKPAVGSGELNSFDDGKDTEGHVGCLGKLQIYRQASHSELSAEASVKSADGLENTEECYSKKQKMQEIAVVFVTRLAHWPASLAFSLWWDYTQNQHHLRLLAQQAYAVHCSAMMSHTLKLWQLQLMGIQRATAFRNKQLLQKAMKGLIKYSQLQKDKALLVVKSRGHLVKHVLSKVFPFWVTKAQEQQYQRNIIHLWTSVTQKKHSYCHWK
ncbi:protein SFI1 homolog isoform X2 [Pomacea canaliculata]|uniref:protein SFI1 homolog isoform X2 n=1 Tax=Pomacea canaliculata TaxID=400727 RepID=UPI000D725DD9|nr:protein SFI1 homolog isoform X2 [Pomacea canaliculata]